MNYDNQLPDESVNLSKQSPSTQLISLIFYTALICLSSVFLLNFIGNHLGPLIPISIQKSFSKRYVVQSKSSKHLERLNFSKRLFNEILIHADVKDTSQWELMYTDLKMPAATLPGKIIFISDELFKHVCSSNALSFVLAHEIAHAKFNHPERGLGKILPTLFLNFFFPSEASGILSGMKNLLELKISRDDEMKADNFAKEQVLKIYGHLDGAGEFFKNILKDQKAQTFHWFSTHPDAKQRLENLSLSKGGKIYLLPKTIQNDKCFL